LLSRTNRSPRTSPVMVVGLGPMTTTEPSNRSSRTPPLPRARSSRLDARLERCFLEEHLLGLLLADREELEIGDQVPNDPVLRLSQVLLVRRAAHAEAARYSPSSLRGGTCNTRSGGP